MAWSMGFVHGLMPMEKVTIAWSLKRQSDNMAESWAMLAFAVSSCMACEGRLMNMRSMEDAV